MLCLIDIIRNYGFALGIKRGDQSTLPSTMSSNHSLFPMWTSKDQHDLLPMPAGLATVTSSTSKSASPVEHDFLPLPATAESAASYSLTMSASQVHYDLLSLPVATATVAPSSSTMLASPVKAAQTTLGSLARLPQMIRQFKSDTEDIIAKFTIYNHKKFRSKGKI